MGVEDFLPDDVEPPQGRSDESAFWRVYWDAEVTPWDVDGPHPELVRRRELDGPGDAFVPGCGRGHDAAHLVARGWRVTAVDFAAPSHEIVRAITAGDGCFVAADAFEWTGEAEFDLWLEHTFYCAIPPDRRDDWGRLAARVIRPGGRLLAVVFPIGKPAGEGGPPFGVTVAGMSGHLGSEFELLSDEPVTQRVERRTASERLTVWRRA